MSMKRFFAVTITLAVASLSFAPEGAVPSSHDMPEHKTLERRVAPAGRDSDLVAPKLAAEYAADGATCYGLSSTRVADLEPTLGPELKQSRQRGNVTVSSLVAQALADQQRILLERKAELERWTQADQAFFKLWFGTNGHDARLLIYDRIRMVTLINHEYSVGNFRAAKDATREVYAFVFAKDPGKIYVGKLFVFAPFLGANSRAGTLVHEMSHFIVAGGTKDHTYGVVSCKNLARSDPAKALRNADNFELYVEGAR